MTLRRGIRPATSRSRRDWFPSSRSTQSTPADHGDPSGSGAEARRNSGGPAAIAGIAHAETNRRGGRGHRVLQIVDAPAARCPRAAESRSTRREISETSSPRCDEDRRRRPACAVEKPIRRAGGGEAAEPGSSSLRTAASAPRWFSRMRAFAAAYLSIVPCRSRWSGVMFVTTATSGGIDRSFRAETRTVRRRSRAGRARRAEVGERRADVSGQRHRAAAARQAAPRSSVATVDLPFVPVTPT